MKKLRCKACSGHFQIDTWPFDAEYCPFCGEHETLREWDP